MNIENYTEVQSSFHSRASISNLDLSGQDHLCIQL